MKKFGISISDQCLYRSTFDAESQYMLLGIGDFALWGQENQVACALRQLDELQASLPSGELEDLLKKAASLKRFAIFVMSSWAELGQLDLCGDRRPGAFTARLLSLTQTYNIPVICGESRKGCYALIERYLAGEDIWPGDFKQTPLPPILRVGSGMPKRNTMRGLEDRVEFHSLKYMDVFWAIKNGTTYPKIIRETSKKFKYFGLFYLKQGIPEDIGAESALREACEQTDSVFATEQENVNARIVEYSVPQALWRRFLSDVDNQFNHHE